MQRCALLPSGAFPFAALQGRSLRGLFCILFFLIDSPSLKGTRKWQQQGLLWPGVMPTITSPARASSAIVAALPPSLHRSALNRACCSAACCHTQKKKPKTKPWDPSASPDNSPRLERWAPSEHNDRYWDSAELLVIVAELYSSFSGFPITCFVTILFFQSSFL